MAYFESPEDLFEATGLDLDDVIDVDVSAGKHDCTDYFGYIKDKDGIYRQISYTCSYNNGCEHIEIDLVTKYVQQEEIVTTIVYKPVVG